MVDWVLDLDISGYFDHIQHDAPRRFLGHRVADKRLLRVVDKWLRAAVLDGGDWLKSEAGSPLGTVVSPLLANICLHYRFDLWAYRWRRRSARGNVIMVRYADDIVMGFEHKEDADGFLQALVERLADFGLTLHPDKTYRSAGTNL